MQIPPEIIAALEATREEVSKSTATEAELAIMASVVAKGAEMAPLIAQYNEVAAKLQAMDDEREALLSSLWKDVAIRHGYESNQEANAKGASFRFVPESKSVILYRKKEGQAAGVVPAPVAQAEQAAAAAGEASAG